MTVQPTSANAYQLHKDSGKAGTQRNKIMIVLRYAEYPYTNREIAQCLGMEPSTVSARRNELIKKGLVKMGRARKCSITGVTAYTWEAVA